MKKYLKKYKKVVDKKDKKMYSPFRCRKGQTKFCKCLKRNEIFSVLYGCLQK